MAAFAHAGTGMEPFHTPEGVDVGVEGRTVVVTIAEGVSLDRIEAKRVNREFMHTLRNGDFDACLTVLEAENPLTSAAFEEVQRAGAASIAHGVARWAVVDERETGLTFSEQIAGIETQLFEDRAAALDWTNDA